MNEIYVVIGSMGVYSDHREWTVRAFADRDAAETFARAAEAHVRELVADAAFNDRMVWPEPEADLDRLAKFDQTLVYTIESGRYAGRRSTNSYSYAEEGPEYKVVVVPFDGEVGS